jgi:hypothetical protein
MYPAFGWMKELEPGRMTEYDDDKRIVRPVDTGTLFVFVEVPETALPALVVSLKETCALLQAPAAK